MRQTEKALFPKRFLLRNMRDGISKPLFYVALIQPEIPSNTGNIGRSCLAFQSELQLVRPLGFDISDKRLKRAGLDYWPRLRPRVYSSWIQWMREREKPPQTWLFSVRGQRRLNEIQIQKGAALVFGSETQGLSACLLSQFPDQTVQIPFPGGARSLNLANAVSIALFEGYRQTEKQPESSASR